MTGEPFPSALLRQLPSSGSTQRRQPTYAIPAQKTLTIGRDPACQIVIDSLLHGTVSRRHAEIRPSTIAETGIVPSWWICDLKSSNGTFINGQRLVGCQKLKAGDRIVLGHHGPEFVFEYAGALDTRVADVPNPTGSPQEAIPARVQSGDLPSGGYAEGAVESASVKEAHDHNSGVTITQLFPIFSTGLEITRKAYIVPAAITISCVVALFITVGRPMWFNLVLASYLAGAAYYVVYRLCGKSKSWIILLGTAIGTIGLLRSPVLLLFITVFRDILPGKVPQPGEMLNFWSLLVRMFFGAGLMEELFKALPLFFLALLGMARSPRWRDRFGLREPLDGILLGTASAIGFTLLETLGQYVPDMVQYTVLQAGGDLSQLQGLHLLIPRLLGSISGHMAYSGYFGYAIGLSILKPERAWLTLGTGYLTAAVLHTLWNTMGSVSPVILALVGLLSYALLGASILKARSLSPTRDQNFATQLKM